MQPSLRDIVIATLLLSCLAMTKTVEGGLSQSSEEDCDWVCRSDGQFNEEATRDRYLVTAKDKRSLDILAEKLENNGDCKDSSRVLKTTENLICMAVVQMTTECAEEVREWGYDIERNSYHFTDAVNVPWHLDRIRNTEATPTPQIPFEINGDGSGVTIFLLDTGIFTDHEQFGDTQVEFLKDVTSSDQDQNLGDPNGHGTQVASVAVGKDYGLARKATLKSIRVANQNGEALTEHCVLGFGAVRESNPGDKCVVIYSLSGGESESLERAINTLVEQTNCIVVVSAGNANADACAYTPAKMSWNSDKVITAGASRVVNGADRKAGFSNFGRCVDIYAPGHKMVLADATGVSSTVKTSGTSFSAPLVAGAAAVLLGNGESPGNIKQRLLDEALTGKLSELPNNSNNLLLNIANF